MSLEAALSVPFSFAVADGEQVRVWRHPMAINAWPSRARLQPDHNERAHDLQRRDALAEDGPGEEQHRDRLEIERRRIVQRVEARKQPNRAVNAVP